MSAPIVDLTRHPALRLNRALINFFGQAFPSVPLLRDFLPERLFGLFLSPRAGRFIVPTLWGASIVVEPKVGGIVENFLYRSGSYETGMRKIIQRIVCPGDTVIDAGANIGAITLWLAHCVGPQGRVHAFEPVASTAALLQQSLQLNKASHVTLHPLALSDAPRRAPIFASTGLNRGGVSLMSEGHAAALAEEVQLDTLSNIFTPQSWAQVSFMKIDVEGWEYELLQGAHSLFATGHIPSMVMEFSKEIPARADKLFAQLQSLPGCSIYRMKYTKRADGPLIKVTHQDELPYHDNIFILPQATAERLGSLIRR